MRQANNMKIAVAGTGYVGLVTGVALANAGHHVTCVDVDEHKIQLMKQGISPIYEPDLEPLMQKNKERLSYTTDYASAYQDAQAIFVGVGTPEKKDGSANLKYVYTVIDQIAQTLDTDCVVVIKSTVPIGTNDKIEKRLTQQITARRSKLGLSPIRVAIASNPEFLSQGTAVKDTLHASRIVIGVESDWARDRMKEVYQEFHQPFVFTDRRSAEMVKYASNDFLALKISYINEIANLCELLDANIEDVAKGMGLDPRIGNRFLKAGIGYGGSCFPKDTKALHWVSNYYEKELKTVKAAIEVNDIQKMKLLKKSHKYYDSLEGLKVAVLGLTFKPDTDDLREAPSLINIPIMLDDGARIFAWDPIGIPNFKKYYPDEITYCSSIEDTLKDADICFIFTEWAQIRDFDILRYKELMAHPIILDGRNCYPSHNFENTGIIYDSVGRRTVQ